MAAVAREGKSAAGTGGGGGGRSSCSSAARAHEPGLAHAEATAMSSGVGGLTLSLSLAVVRALRIWEFWGERAGGGGVRVFYTTGRPALCPCACGVVYGLESDKENKSRPAHGSHGVGFQSTSDLSKPQ